MDISIILNSGMILVYTKVNNAYIYCDLLIMPKQGVKLPLDFVDKIMRNGQIVWQR